MKVMVVGGSGNISATVVEHLVAQGHEVTIFNRGQRQFAPPPKGVKVLLGNRDDCADFEARMQAEQPDVAIDMICYSKEHAQSDLRAFPKVQHFIFCSTVCVYGTNQMDLPMDETVIPKPLTLTNPATIGKIYNCVSQRVVSWDEFYRIGMDILGKEVPLVGVSLQTMQALGAEKFGCACEIFAFNLVQDYHILHRDFPSFREEISLEDGMREVILYCQTHGRLQHSAHEAFYDALAETLSNITV